MPVGSPLLAPNLLITGPDVGQRQSGAGRTGGRGGAGAGRDADGRAPLPDADEVPRPASAGGELRPADADGDEPLAPPGGGLSRMRWPTKIRSGSGRKFQHASSRWSSR